MNRGRKIILWFLTLAAGITAAALFTLGSRYPDVAPTPLPRHTAPAAGTATAAPIKAPQKATGSTAQTPPAPAPNTDDRVLLSVPFTSQAPTGNWDEFHNEACEEASALMANEYFRGNRSATLAADEVERGLSALAAWEQSAFGYHLDTTVAETARMIRENYGLTVELKENFSESDLKTALAAGKLVLISTNGRLLGNPYYKQPGPIHHMLVLRGYTVTGDFVTNDPGTRRGQNYPYPFQTLYGAAADWDHARGTTDTSIKIAMIVSR